METGLDLNGYSINVPFLSQGIIKNQKVQIVYFLMMLVLIKQFLIIVFEMRLFGIFVRPTITIIK